MPKLVVRIEDEAYKALVLRAVDERRAVQDEAALLIERTLLRVKPAQAASVAASSPSPAREVAR